VTPTLAEKVHRLLEQRRVLLVAGRPDEALVIGDNGLHDVVAVPSGVACTCIASGGGRLCSHALAAMVAWGERDAEVPW
jgi:hypothetical protein